MFGEIQSQVYIGDKLIPVFKSLVLSQEIDAHHDFKVVCRKDVLESSSQEIFGESKGFLGEKFVVILDSDSNSGQQNSLQFKGVVTAINSIKGFYYGDGDLIEIKGKSASIISDDGPHFSSFLDYDLSEILQRTFKSYDRSLLELNINPENNSKIHYSVQQNESAFKYASRLASQYGEWFYYNGTHLVFGQVQRKESVKLNYGADLMELSINLEPAPNRFKYITNDYFTDSLHEAKTQEISSKINGEHAFVSNKADSLFPNETQIFVNSYDDPSMKYRMDEQIRKQKLAQEANQIKVIGKSYNTGVQIGSIIEIEGEESYYGNYRVTKVTHDVNLNGHYENSFEAIPESVSVYPKMSISAFPESKSQTAVVVNNNDPEGLGRVQVQYPWQKPLGETTPFVRLSSTAAGAGQGFFMVPEIGDEVVVGYEGGNAESPIVQGSLYNASSVPESFKSGNNHLKAIKTRSGNQVTLNDADGSVTIADPSGNTIVMGGNGEITINAPNKITFSSKDIAIEASNDLTVNAGNNITSTAATNIKSSAGTNLSMDAGSDLSAKAGSKATFNGKKSISIFGKRASITGSVMTNIQSGALVTIISAGLLNITGATSYINGKIMKLIGKQVEINN